MKVVVIGGNGTIGSAVVEALRKSGHQVSAASRKTVPPVDLERPETVATLLGLKKAFDAVVVCAGSGGWKPLEKLTDEDFAFSLRNKLMGQVNVVRTAKDLVKDGGSITVTSGILATHPQPGSSAISLVNAGLDAFVRAAALEMPRGIRVNVVSPPWVKESLRAMKMDDSHGMSAADVAKAYVAAVEGTTNGQTLDPAKLK
jgi:NAD(P)-dependent dehydrogenase (short-subunit alcohol dehydrogenase family)